jgi:hypothetical protein
MGRDDDDDDDDDDPIGPDQSAHRPNRVWIRVP